MTTQPRPLDSSRIDINRRQFAVSAGTFLAGGGIAVALGSSTTRAAVTASSISIPEETVKGENTSVSSATLSVTGMYQYEVNNADTLLLSLAVAPEGTENFETIDSTEEVAGADAGSGSYELAGSLTAHSALDYGTFSADTGESVSLDLPVRVTLDVRHGGETVVSGIAEGVAPIRVTNTGVEATATIAGSGKASVAV